MCQLLCETDIALDKDSARYWCEEGARLFPHDNEVFRLKEKLLKLGGQANSQAFEELINCKFNNTYTQSDTCLLRSRVKIGLMSFILTYIYYINYIIRQYTELFS